jgi:hypothetical protein
MLLLLQKVFFPFGPKLTFVLLFIIVFFCGMEESKGGMNEYHE